MSEHPVNLAVIADGLVAPSEILEAISQLWDLQCMAKPVLNQQNDVDILNKVSSKKPKDCVPHSFPSWEVCQTHNGTVFSSSLWKI